MTPSVILRYNRACYQLVTVTPSVILRYNRACYQLVIVTPSVILRYNRTRYQLVIVTPSVILRYNRACYQLVIVTPSVILRYNRACYQLVIVTPSVILRYNRACYQLVIVTPSVILRYNRACYQLVIVTPSVILRYNSACYQEVPLYRDGLHPLCGQYFTSIQHIKRSFGHWDMYCARSRNQGLLNPIIINTSIESSFRFAKFFFRLVPATYNEHWGKGLSTCNSFINARCLDKGVHLTPLSVCGTGLVTSDFSLKYCRYQYLCYRGRNIMGELSIPWLLIPWLQASPGHPQP